LFRVGEFESPSSTVDYESHSVDHGAPN